MKKQLVLGMFAFFAMAGTAMAQEGAQGASQGQGMQMKAPNERAKETVLKLQSDLSVSNDQGGKLMEIFTNYYTQQQKAFEAMRANGGDRESMRSTMTKLADERDVQLKALFTADQYTKWKDVVEPSMRPQRRGGNN